MRFALETIALPQGADPAVYLVDPLPPPGPPALPGLNPTDPAHDDALRPSGASSVTIRGFTFDFTKVGGRATILFPFLSPGLSLNQFALQVQPIDDHLRLPPEYAPAGERASGNRPPLELSDRAFQAIIDQSWSRRDRWTSFQTIARLAETHNANAGQLPALLRAYTEQDGLQPYSDPGIRDPRLWTELQIAADHVEFVGFISRYTSAHPGSRATIELLFLLDKLMQASRDALVTLLDTDAYVDLAWTRQANLDAMTFVAKLEHHYNDVLEQKGLSRRELLGAHYDTLRLGILNGILSTAPDGYRAADARFLIGAIYWRQGRKADAVRSWRDITMSPKDEYQTTDSDIVAAVLRLGTPIAPVSETEIERILSADYGRWLSASIDRLKKFGYQMDKY